MMYRIIKLAELCLCLVAIGGCSKYNASMISIDGHSFNMPSKYLVDSSVPWLPETQHNGLMFYINPDDPLPDRVSVLIQSSSITCRTDEPLHATPLSLACLAAKKGEVAEQGGELEKFHPDEDPSQWEYRLKGKLGANQEVVVASCSAMGDGNGLCHTFSTYRDLVYTIGFRDKDIETLPAFRKKVQNLLSSWELR